MSEDNAIANWVTRTSKKGPFYVYSSEPLKSKGTEYTLMFIMKRKVYLCKVSDGMLCRYGLRTFATVTDRCTLWGDLNEDQLDCALLLLEGKNQMETFEISSLKNLRH